MTRYFAALLIAITVSIAPASAQVAPVAPPTGTPTFTAVPNITASYNSNFIAPVPCDIFSGGAADWCTALNVKIASYNQTLGFLNQIQQYQQQAQLYLTYPQQLANSAQTDFNHLMGIVSVIPSLTYATTNPVLSINTQQQQINNLPNPAQLNTVLTQSLDGQIGGNLKATQTLMNQDERDRAQISAIQQAAATAKSPQQIEALNLQLLTILSAQLSRLQEIEGSQINLESTYFFNQNARDSAAARNAQQATTSGGLIDPVITH